MNQWVKTVGSSAMVLLLASACAMIAYARWTQPVADADTATAAGDVGRALESYAVAERRFDALPPLKWLLSSEYDRIVANQLRLLFHVDRNEDTLEKAARAPEGANPHFWAGAACFEQGRAEEDPSARLAWFGRAQQELVKALDAAPDDWDTKFDLVKLNPLAAWTEKQVWAYVMANNVPYNELHDKNYPSIGCTYCTKPVAKGADPRSGRWQGFDKEECGIQEGSITILEHEGKIQ